MIATPANAQLRGGNLDLRLFRPAVDSKGQLGLNGAEVLGAGDVSFGLVLDAGWSAIDFDGFVDDQTASSDDAVRVDHLVDHLLVGSLLGSFGIGNVAVVGVEVPIVAASGANVVVPGQYNDGARPRGLDVQGLGDIGLHGKLRLLRSDRDGIGIAALLRIDLPTGPSDTVVGTGGVALWPSVAIERRIAGRLGLTANLGYRLPLRDGATLRHGGRTESQGLNASAARLLNDRGEDLADGQQITFGLGAGFRIAPTIDLIVEGYGRQIMASIGRPFALSMEGLVGMKIFVDRNSYLMIGAGGGLIPGMSAADTRGVLGFIFEPSIGDRDGDGLKDDDDQCPDEPEDFDDFADHDGCSESDNDRDGVLDVDDACPLVPEDRDGDRDDDGCPEGDGGDRDGDGIADSADACPDDPEDRDDFEDADGCPDPDNDGDGIYDVDDLCPIAPEDVDGFEDIDGCPDPDNDGDRILDVDDECDGDPETYNAYLDEDGCPDVGIIEMTDGGFILLEKIFFETDSARIMPRSQRVLDAIAAALAGHPEIHLVEIQGHADERSSDQYNLDLTRDRALSVRQGLVERGIAAVRMRAAGYGERCPLDPGHGRRAWDRNRRVEIKILETDEGSTHVRLACPAARDLVAH